MLEEALQTAAQLQQQGRLAEAEQIYRQILSQQPNHPQALRDFGILAHSIGRNDVAAMLMERSLASRPDHLDTLVDLAEIYRLLGRTADAIAFCRRAIALNDRSAAAHNRLAVIAYYDGDLQTAIDSWQRATAIQPDAQTFSNLTAALVDAGKIPEAIVAGEAALRFDPNHSGALSNLGTAMRDLGRIDRAMDLYRHASDVSPNGQKPASARLHLMTHHSDFDNAALLQAHREWADRFASGIERLPPAQNDRDPDRRIRIGYVSPHFYSQSVFTFLEPLLAGHDKSRVEIFCYSDTKIPDAATDRAKTYADHWRDARGLSDDQLASQIRDDAIDILVDMTGHLANNRLSMFARKPAPIQVTYLGYQHTTGLAAMDFRFTDAWADPPDSDEFYVEKLVRLPKRFFAYRPVDDSLAISDPPMESTDHITFGSFNHLVKLSRPCLAAWAKILAAVPDSRLLLLAPAEDREFLSPLIEAGISEDRIDLTPRCSPVDFLKLIPRADIALDPFPFNGHTTTCDTLWMGVPVVTLAGRTFAGRMSTSVLRNLDLGELIAESVDDYVKLAVDLANDRSRIAELRRTLRDRMKSSPLLDGKSFARDVEEAYRTMWRGYCDATSSS